MTTQTTTTTGPGPGPVFLHDFTIYPQAQEIYAYNEGESFHVRDLTIDDLNRLHSDIKNELGEDQASEIMQQLTTNK